jgi:hypothetical protein
VNKVRDIANDIAHIAFACLILGLPAFFWWGFIISGVLLGWLVETKEENSNITKVPLTDLSFRDWMGYATGGLICSLVARIITW